MSEEEKKQAVQKDKDIEESGKSQEQKNGFSLAPLIENIIKEEWVPMIVNIIWKDPSHNFRNSKDIKIMVVDDELGLREALYMILKDSYTVVTADNAADAKEKLKQGRIDIMVLDIRMPEMDGLTFLNEVKATYPDIEVFLMTGHPDADSAIEAVKRGAYDYIIKPFDKSKIEEAIKRGIIRRIYSVLHKDMFSKLLKNKLD